MVLINCSDLLRLDLDGVHVLVPHLLKALEAILPERELKLRSNSVHKTELRRAGIHLLISMLSLPSHFMVRLVLNEFSKPDLFLSWILQNMPIKDLLPNRNQASGQPITFLALRSRMINLVINALQVETEAINTQMLLGTA